MFTFQTLAHLSMDHVAWTLVHAIISWQTCKFQFRLGGKVRVALIRVD